MTRQPIDFTGFVLAAAFILVWAFGVSGCAREMPRDDLSWRVLRMDQQRDRHEHREWRHER